MRERTRQRPVRQRILRPVEPGSAYQGGVAMWSFLFHRVTGVVLAAWVLLFTIEQSTLLSGPDSYDRFRDVLTTGPFRLFEIAVATSAIFHALNGIRIVLTDFVPSIAAHTNRILRVQTGVFFALAVPATWIILVRYFEVG